MAKPGRNDRCPCASGKKYKTCCLAKDEAAARDRLAVAQAARDDRAAETRQRRDEARAARLARLAADDDLDDDPTEASNAVLDLIRAGKLDAAEAAARDLLARYPDIHDGWDRLGHVHEVRGDRAQAIDCYRRVVLFLEHNPDYAEPAFKEVILARIARLEAAASP